jgi:hypothetical protein
VPQPAKAIDNATTGRHFNRAAVLNAARILFAVCLATIERREDFHRFIVVVNKTFRYSNFFSTTPDVAIPEFGT